jgi:hypothetical protein
VLFFSPRVAPRSCSYRHRSSATFCHRRPFMSGRTSSRRRWPFISGRIFSRTSSAGMGERWGKVIIGEMWEGIGEDGEDEPCDGLTGLGEGIGEDGAAAAAASRCPPMRPPCSGRRHARRHRLLALSPHRGRLLTMSPRRGTPPPRRAGPWPPPRACVAAPSPPPRAGTVSRPGAFFRVSVGLSFVSHMDWLWRDIP